MAKSTKKDPTRARFCGRTSSMENGPGIRARIGGPREYSRILCASKVEFPNNETSATRAPRPFGEKRSFFYVVKEIPLIRYVCLVNFQFLNSFFNF